MVIKNVQIFHLPLKILHLSGQGTRATPTHVA